MVYSRDINACFLIKSDARQGRLHDVPGFKDYVLMLIATRGNASTQYGDMDTNFPHSDFGLYTKLLSLAAFKSSQKMGSG